MRNILFISMIGIFMMACGETTAFQGDDLRFKALMNGETVEVVSDDSVGADGFDEVALLADEGVVTVDEGSAGSEESAVEEETSIDRPGNSENARRNNNEERTTGKKRSGFEAMRRILLQDDMQQYEDMEISEEEMEDIPFLTCGKNNKKIIVCHHPNGKYDKRKSLCVGRGMLPNKGLLKTRNKEIQNYAGLCEGHTMEDLNGAGYLKQ